MVVNLKKYIRDIPDFPEKGIIFKDITPLLQNAEAYAYASEALLNLVNTKHIQKVVGMESRGFFFAPLLAKALNAGFVPVRKPGKLPFTTIHKNYGLEYGSDTLEMHTDSILPGEQVLIHDDVLATGGTAEAVCDMVTAMGGIIVGCNFLIELDFLKGRERLQQHPIKSLINY